MTAYDPLYLLTLYAPRSIDPDEATVLTPAAGAPHAQPFRVATRPFGRAVRIGATTGRYLIRNPVGTWPTSAITVEFWGRLDAGLSKTLSHYAFSYAEAGNSNELLFGLISVAGPEWRPRFELNGGAIQSANNFPDDHKYHHFLGRWRQSDGSAQIFIDGVLDTTGTIAVGAIAGGGAVVLGQEQDALGGGFDANQAWKGEEDEVRVYTRYVSDLEAKQHAGGIYIDETGLCARWGFDFNGTRIGKDSSSAGNDLTPVGITDGTEDTPLHFQPYLDVPRGRNGRISPLERKVDSGEWALPLIDKRVANDDTSAGLKRWLTAFLGNAKGQPRLAGLKFLANASFDGGLVVEPWRVGRISSLTVGPVNAMLSARDITDEAKMAVFTGAPHSSITYAARQAVCPVGIMGSDYGTIKAVTPLKGTAKTVTINALNQLPAVFTRVGINLSVARPDNIATRQLVNAAAPNDSAGFIPSTVLGGDANAAIIPNFSGPLRARVKHTSGALSGQTGDYKAAGLGYVQGPNGKMRLAQVALEALDAGDVSQLAVPANGVTVEVVLWVDGPASKDNPILLNDVHFATLLQDLCDGKFGYLYRSPESLPGGKSYGDAKRTVPLANSAAFIADTTYPKQRFVITKRDELITWVEKNILKPLNVALYADEQGRLAIVDLRLPSSLVGIPALTETDLARDKPQGEWSFDREKVISRVEFMRYSDRPVKIEELVGASGTFPDMPPGLVESFDHPLIVLDVGATDVGDRAYEVDAPGFRSMDGETLEGQARGVYLENKLVEIANQWRRPFGWGLIELPATLRRGGAAVVPGGLVTATFQHVPDPTTWQRGGTRVCRALEVSPEGAERRVVLLDLGMSQTAIVPTLGAPAQETDNTYAGVTSVLTLNGEGQAAEVRYAVTDTSVAVVPADTSSLWTVFGRFTTSQTVAIRKLPANRRIWVQGRTLPDYIDGQQPSAWTNAGGSGRVDTAALPAPSAPAASLQTARSFRVSWTNGAVELATELLIATPTTDPRVVVARVLPGSTLFNFPGDTGLVLAPSTTYRVGVRHVLVNRSGVGGVSAEVTVDPVTTASEPIIQPPIRLREYY